MRETFFGPCKDKSGKIIRQGYKMKWHNIGSGRVQLRLLIVLAHEKAYTFRQGYKHTCIQICFRYSAFNHGGFHERKNDTVKF